jgi:hypothetical protein
MIDEKLKKRRMEIALENAVGTVHDTEGTDMEDGIPATSILLGPRAFFNECTFIR